MCVYSFLPLLLVLPLVVLINIIILLLFLQFIVALSSYADGPTGICTEWITDTYQSGK